MAQVVGQVAFLTTGSGKRHHLGLRLYRHGTFVISGIYADHAFRAFDSTHRVSYSMPPQPFLHHRALRAAAYRSRPLHDDPVMVHDGADRAALFRGLTASRRPHGVRILVGHYPRLPQFHPVYQ